MLSKELKEMIEIGGGKVIVSEGDVEKSYVVMKLKNYLAEKKIVPKEEKTDGNNLTMEKNFDKIDAEIDEFYQREKAKELDELLKAEREEYSYEKI